MFTLGHYNPKMKDVTDFKGIPGNKVNLEFVLDYPHTLEECERLFN